MGLEQERKEGHYVLASSNAWLASLSDAACADVRVDRDLSILLLLLRDTEKLPAYQQNPGASSQCNPTSQFLRLELQRAGESPPLK